jgi:hypothetical protein
MPPPPPPNYASRDPGYPGYPRSVSTPASPHPGEEPLRVSPLAFLSVVFAFCVPVAGLVLGVIALVQTREPGRGGRGVAVAGTILSLLSTVGLVVLTIKVMGGRPS